MMVPVDSVNVTCDLSKHVDHRVPYADLEKGDYILIDSLGRNELERKFVGLVTHPVPNEWGGLRVATNLNDALGTYNVKEAAYHGKVVYVIH